VTPPTFFSATGSLGVGDVVALDGDEGRHAADVRRLRVGEAIDLTDGAGVVLRGVVAEVRRGKLTVTVQERLSVAAPTPRFTVVQALARGGRDEQAVESMTEVGVDRVVGWEASRNVAHWTDRTQAKWSATARTAAKQARRAWWPQISGPATTAEVAAMCSAADLAVVLHESATTSINAAVVPTVGEVVIVVGPEGGITEDELAAFAAADAVAVRLGDNVLRSSTAGVAALAVVSAATRWT
jgi:16S rRNA (uracil1498-N3)-methyltransferase